MSLLLEAIAHRRDRQAFSQLFEYFAPRLKGFALKRGISATAAEELVQETMLSVWRKAETFDPRRATVSTWIFTIVRNKRIDLLRRASYPEVELDELAEYPSDAAGPDDDTTWAQFGTHLRNAMQTLPQEQFDILHKAFFEEKTHRSIADELGLPLGTVKSRIRLALIRLRSVLPEDVR